MLALSALVARGGEASPAVRRWRRPGSTCPIGDPSRADQEYVWISNASNLPLFVERVYPGLESARKALNVKVRIAGPTSVDLAAFITTVDAECTKNPAGVIVVGGWDDALASEVDKCIDKKVPDRRHRRRPADVQAPHLPRHQLVQPRLPARPVPVPLPQGRRAQGRRDRHHLVPRRDATSSRPARACATPSPRVPGRQGGRRRGVGHQRRAGRRQHRGDHPGPPQPDRHGGLRLRGRPGHRPRRHRGGQGRQDHRHLERGRPRLPELDQGRHGQDDQHGEVRDDGLLRASCTSTPSTTTSSATSAWTTGCRTRCRPSATRA